MKSCLCFENYSPKCHAMEQDTSVNIEDSCSDTIYLFFGDVEIGDMLQITFHVKCRTHCLSVELKTTILSPLSCCMCILVSLHGLCHPFDSRESDAH